MQAILYAAGFLYGLIGFAPGCAVKQAQYLMRNAIEVIGTKMDQERWQKVRTAIGMLNN